VSLFFVVVQRVACTQIPFVMKVALVCSVLISVVVYVGACLGLGLRLVV